MVKAPKTLSAGLHMIMMLTDHDGEELSAHLARVRSKMNFICDLLNAELMETSILSCLDTKQGREQNLITKVRDLNKVIEYYVMNHKLVPLKSREKIKGVEK